MKLAKLIKSCKRAVRFQDANDNARKKSSGTTGDSDPRFSRKHGNRGRRLGHTYSRPRQNEKSAADGTLPTIALANLCIGEDLGDLGHELPRQRCCTADHISDAGKIIPFNFRMLVSLDYNP